MCYDIKHCSLRLVPAMINHLTSIVFTLTSDLQEDGFKKGQHIPECQLIVQWERKDQKPLRHRVNLIGAKAPNNFIYLIVDPSMEGKRSWYSRLYLVMCSYELCDSSTHNTVHNQIWPLILRASWVATQDG